MSDHFTPQGAFARSSHVLRAVGALAGITLLTACAGGVGAGGDGGGTGSGEGFDYSAEQATVDGIVEDLDPVTINYQSGAPSPNALVATPALQFKEYIEERSNGKITVDLHWSGSIASYAEVDDALADGRLDVAYVIPTYHVSEYPIYDALAKLTIYGPSTPLAGEAVTMAMMTHMAYENEGFHAEFTDKGLRALTPMISTGTYGTWCSSPNEVASDWAGSTISVPNTSANAIVQALGASPVSLEYGEMFEGLQRNTIQCTTATPSSASAGGIVEVAPHLAYPTSGGITRTASANVAGANFDRLPLAYQQIIFDADTALSDGFLKSIEATTVDDVDVSRQNGGDFRPFDAESQRIIDETQRGIVDQAVEEGHISQEDVDRAQELSEYWEGRAAEVGLTDEGDLGDFDDWYEPGAVDFKPLMELVFEEVLQERRPGS
ncbi:MAG: C4-dicarboxylate ABC transporter substrate-binding protein [Gordonia sp. (in: high G+C Gram-positive bacteria)]|nr:MAG: C4-dicarboxylate ABC transporter substrate-binding protein [Gordonia sp. (in: high G+C Gram-positive bacteria)]